MKYYFYAVFAILVCCSLACCKKKSDEVMITGQLEGVEDGVVITLCKLDGNIFVDLQSDTITGGIFNFSFPDSVNQAKPMLIMADGEGFPPTWLDIWVAPGVEIRITGNDKLLRSWNVKSNVSEQLELNKYNARIEPYERLSQSVMRDAYAYFDKIDEFPERRKEFRPKIDSLYAINDSLNLLIMETEIAFMDENKTYSPVWMEKLNRHVSALKYTKVSDVYVKKLKDMYEGMSDELKISEQGQVIHINLYPPAIVQNGEDMADGDMWNTEGDLCRLADYKGKFLLLDFWSAGCGPCIMAIPEMKEISEMYREQLIVVSISSDPKDIWKRVSEEKGFTWVNLNDFKGENGIKLRYGVKGIPHYVMISPEGKVMTSWTGYGEGSLKRRMEELITL